jgi:hypothetical protein
MHCHFVTCIYLFHVTGKDLGIVKELSVDLSPTFQTEKGRVEVERTL